MADSVRDDDVILLSIDWLPCPKQFSRKGGGQHALCRAATAVQDNDGNSTRLADRYVMEPQFRHDLARVEFEVLGVPFALLWRWEVGGVACKRDCCENKCCNGSEGHDSVSYPFAEGT